MTGLQKVIAGGTLAAVVGIVIYEVRLGSTWRTKAETMQKEQAAGQSLEAKRRDAASGGLVDKAPQTLSSDNDREELLRLRSEVGTLQRQLAEANAQLRMREQPIALPPGNATTPESNSTPVALSPVDAAKALATNLVNGDATAFAKLLDLSKTEHQTFNGGRGATNDSQRGDLARDTFAPLRAAYGVISDAATNGNHLATDAIFRSLAYPELAGMAVSALGPLAATGNDKALAALTDPDKYGILLSSSVGALKPAADSGSQPAINFLAGVIQNDQNQGLWFMAADGLSKAAEAGNSTAIDALARVLSGNNPSVRRVAIGALRQAAANQSPRAAAALSAAGIF